MNQSSPDRSAHGTLGQQQREGGGGQRQQERNSSTRAPVAGAFGMRAAARQAEWFAGRWPMAEAGMRLRGGARSGDGNG
jgi:hypothetical protein